MADSFKQPCIFIDNAHAVAGCVPDKNKSLCCGCEQECGTICEDIFWEHKLIGDPICGECQGAKIEMRWGTPPVSLTSLVPPAHTLRYQVWRTRKLPSTGPPPGDACDPGCTAQPSSFTSRSALLGECTPDLKIYDEVAENTDFASDVFSGGPPAGAQLVSGGPNPLDTPNYRVNPDICEGIMPNFVLIAIADADVGAGEIELARCFLCPLVPTITTAWRKPMLCPGRVCCPNDEEAYHGPVCVTLAGENYTLTEGGINFYQFAGLISGPTTGDGTISIGCSVVASGGGFDLQWTMTVLIEECQASFTSLGLFGGYDCEPGACGDCGYDEDTDPSAAEGAC